MKYRYLYIAGMYLLAVFLTLMRPYYALLLFVPGYFSAARANTVKKKIGSWAACGVILLVTMIVFFTSMHITAQRFLKKQSGRQAI